MNVIMGGSVPRAVRQHARMSSLIPVDPNQYDRFFLRQKIKLVINQYEFSLEEDGEPFAFVEQARFKFKEDIRFFTDESKSEELLRIKARQAFDPRARYDITAADGSKLGEIQKVFGKSLLRSTYEIHPATGGDPLVARERSMGVALFRRLVGFVPYLDNFADWLPIPYHFDFLRGEEVIGSHERKRWSFRDRYTIDMSGDPQRTVDRRLIMAIAVGMDALQAR
jgi:uncharacterized protein YxjI